MGLVTDELEVGLRIEVEDGLLVIDPDVARMQRLVGDDRLDRQLVLGVDVVVGRGEHHVAWGQRGILRHLRGEEAVPEHIQRNSCGHVITPGIDHQIKISPIARKHEVRMTRRAVKRIVSRIESLKYQLSVGGVGSELFPDPLELVEGLGTKILPLHVLLRANLWPSPPAPAIGPGETAFGIGKKVPEVLGGAEIGDLIVAIDVPHKLPEEVADGHLAKSHRGKPVPQIDFNGLAEDLLIAEVVATYNLGALIEDLAGDLDVLKVEGKAWQGHELTW